ncbi:hypothetical protein [Desulfosediminicola sp.]|uniref:hypothetical protein n=1 Tax=Desulfosediminicola sp. TaxID=2886825 RepID=UPI003AF2DFD7
MEHEGTLKMIHDTDDIRVAINGFSATEDGPCTRQELHVYFGDNCDPSMIFEDWTDEIESLSVESWEQISGMVDKCIGETIDDLAKAEIDMLLDRRG